LGLKVQFATLDIGDYVIPSGYVIERKAVGDFVNSLFSGRLFEQAERLSKVYEAPLILIEGDLQNTVDMLPNPRSIWGAFATLIFTHGARIFFTRDRQQTADFIYTLAVRGGSAAVRPRLYKKVRLKTIEEARIGLLSSLPGIGPKLAHRLLHHFGSARKVFLASVAELTTVEGIGRMKATRIAAILDSQELAQDSICQSKLAA
jgi:ERCC4-type nuclease